MKKVTTKVAKKVVVTTKAKESEFGMLARLVVDGFERVDKRLDGIDNRLDGMDKRFDGIDSRLNGIDSSLSSINHELKGHTRRLDHIERK